MNNVVFTEMKSYNLPFILKGPSDLVLPCICFGVSDFSNTNTEEVGLSKYSFHNALFGSSEQPELTLYQHLISSPRMPTVSNDNVSVPLLVKLEWKLILNLQVAQTRNVYSYSWIKLSCNRFLPEMGQTWLSSFFSLCHAHCNVRSFPSSRCLCKSSILNDFFWDHLLMTLSLPPAFLWFSIMLHFRFPSYCLSQFMVIYWLNYLCSITHARVSAS